MEYQYIIVPVYRSTTHKIKFNALHDRVADEMLLCNTVIKTFNIVIFDRTHITDAVWCMISSLALITLSDSYVAQVLRYNYKRYDLQKHYKHNKVVHQIHSYDKCNNNNCYINKYTDQQNAALIPCVYIIS